MRSRRHVLTLSIVLIAVLLSGVGFFVLNARPKLGLDLTGGLSVVLTTTSQSSEDVLDRTVDVIRDRIDSLGTIEPEVTRSGNDTIIVQLPEVDDPDRALEIIGKTARLRFRPVLGAVGAEEAKAAGLEVTADDPPTGDVVYLGSEENPGTKGQAFNLGPPAVQGEEITSAVAQLDTSAGGWVVALEFSSTGTRKFADITGQLAPAQGALAIVLDQRVESAPAVTAAISDGRGVISGTFTEAEAKDLALILRAGALPVDLEAQQIQKVSATLGDASLQAGLLAGLIGIIAMSLYLAIFYRTLGLVAVVGLASFGFIILGFVGLIGATRGFTLTLAGIAGLIVSLGVSADTYVVYYERLKDELREGKTFRSAVERSFTSALKTNISANSVAFLGAMTLYLFAVGPVRGFALMLGISAVIDIVLLRLYIYPAVALLARRMSRPPATFRFGSETV